MYLTTSSGWPAIGSGIATNGKRLSEFPEIKELLGKGYLCKAVNGIVMGMSAGSSISDKHIDLPMSKRKLNNFHPKCGIESGSASK